VQEEVSEVSHYHRPVQVTLRTENLGSVRDKMVLLMAGFMKVLQGDARLEQIIRANFDDDPCIVFIVRDPVMSGLPDGTIRADVQQLV
jgi:hypothetical protein